MNKRFISLLLCLAIILMVCTKSSTTSLAKAYYAEYNQEQFSYRNMSEVQNRID